MDMKYRKLSCFFLTIYVFSGILFAVLYRSFLRPQIGDILLYSFFALPLIIGLIGTIFWLRNRKPNIFLWACSIYWLFISLSEFFEGGAIVPKKIFVFFIATISVCCILFLVIDKRKRRRQGEEETGGKAGKHQ
jgi:hypothetical protein